jgi:arylsulfatase A-like enzyme
LLRRILDSPWPYFVGAGLLLLVAIATQFEVRLPSRPEGSFEDIAKLRERDDLNVVFILIDTLRADRLGIYGYERPTTEVMDALGSQGVVFADVIAQSSWTKTSMASLWTGTYPVNHGIVRFGDVIPEEAVLPAERFQEAGYRTAGIWRNGWVAPNFGFGQGFDYYLNPKAGRERARIQRGNPSSKALQGTDEDVVYSAFEFLDNFGRDRFFLYLHLMDLHQYTYDDQATHFGTGYSDVYDQALHWTDRLVGAVVGKLDELGIADRTLVAIASDHGEAFQEHGFEGHARNLYAEVTQVPVILCLPFRLDPGIRVEQRVSNHDLWPTILDLVGLPPLANPDGVSLLPLVLAAGRGDAAPAGSARPIYAQLERHWGDADKTSNPLVSVTDGRYRFILPVNSPERAELYDRGEDPGEQHDLADERPEQVGRLRQLVASPLEAGQSPWGAPPGQVELDALRLNQLRALGYVVR